MSLPATSRAKSHMTRKFKVSYVHPNIKFKTENELSITDKYDRNAKVNHYYSSLISKNLRRPSPLNIQNQATTPNSSRRPRSQSKFNLNSLTEASSPKVQRPHITVQTQHLKESVKNDGEFQTGQLNPNLHIPLTTTTPGNKTKWFKRQQQKIQEEERERVQREMLRKKKKKKKVDGSFIPLSPAVFDNYNDDYYEEQDSSKNKSSLQKRPHILDQKISACARQHRKKEPRKERSVLKDPTEGKVRLKHLRILENMKRLGCKVEDFLIPTASPDVPITSHHLQGKTLKRVDSLMESAYGSKKFLIPEEEQVSKNPQNSLASFESFSFVEDEDFEMDKNIFNRIRGITEEETKSKELEEAIQKRKVPQIQIQQIELFDIEKDVSKEQIETNFNEFFKQNYLIPPHILNQFKHKAKQAVDHNKQMDLCSAFTSLIPNLGNLESLFLHQNGINDDGGAFLLENLFKLKYFRRFHFRKNQIGINFANKFLELSQLNPNHLLEFDIAGCKTQKNTMGPITAALKDNVFLTVLDLSGIRLDKIAMNNIGSLIISSPNLRSLNLCNTFLGENEMKICLESIRGNDSIAFLNLSQNSLRHKTHMCILLLGEIIRMHPVLKHLDISHTCIDRDEVLFLVEFLKSNKNILCIHFSGNFIDRNAKCQIRGILKARTAHPLQTISLQDKSIRDQITHLEKMEILKIARFRFKKKGLPSKLLAEDSKIWEEPIQTPLDQPPLSFGEGSPILSPPKYEIKEIMSLKQNDYPTEIIGKFQHPKKNNTTKPIKKQMPDLQTIKSQSSTAKENSEVNSRTSPLTRSSIKQKEINLKKSSNKLILRKRGKSTATHLERSKKPLKKDSIGYKKVPSLDEDKRNLPQITEQKIIPSVRKDRRRESTFSMISKKSSKTTQKTQFSPTTYSPESAHSLLSFRSMKDSPGRESIKRMQTSRTFNNASNSPFHLQSPKFENPTTPTMSKRDTAKKGNKFDSPRRTIQKERRDSLTVPTIKRDSRARRISHQQSKVNLEKEKSPATSRRQSHESGGNKRQSRPTKVQLRNSSTRKPAANINKDEFKSEKTKSIFESESSKLCWPSNQKIVKNKFPASRLKALQYNILNDFDFYGFKKTYQDFVDNLMQTFSPKLVDYEVKKTNFEKKKLEMENQLTRMRKEKILAEKNKTQRLLTKSKAVIPIFATEISQENSQKSINQITHPSPSPQMSFSKDNPNLEKRETGTSFFNDSLMIEQLLSNRTKDDKTPEENEMVAVEGGFIEEKNNEYEKILGKNVEFILQRKTEFRQAYEADQWVDSSACYICQKWSLVTIKINMNDLAVDYEESESEISNSPINSRIPLKKNSKITNLSNKDCNSKETITSPDIGSPPLSPLLQKDDTEKIFYRSSTRKASQSQEGKIPFIISEISDSNISSMSGELKEQPEKKENNEKINLRPVIKQYEDLSEINDVSYAHINLYHPLISPTFRNVQAISLLKSPKNFNTIEGEAPNYPSQFQFLFENKTLENKVYQDSSPLASKMSQYQYLKLESTKRSPSTSSQISQKSKGDFITPKNEELIKQEEMVLPKIATFDIPKLSLKGISNKSSMLTGFKSNKFNISSQQVQISNLPDIRANSPNRNIDETINRNLNENESHSFLRNKKIRRMKKKMDKKNDEIGVVLFSSFNDWIPIQMIQNKQDSSLFEFSDFIKPGIHYCYFIANNKYFCLSSQYEIKELKNSKFFFNILETEEREQSLFKFEYLKRRKEKEYAFDKNASVFKSWKEDTPDFLRKMFETDFSYSKIKRLVKNNDDDRDEVRTILLQNYGKLIEIYKNLNILSFPTISLNDFTSFCNKTHIIDKDLNLATFDRIFIATCVSITTTSCSSERKLSRYEFLEILVRLANSKYKETGQCNSIAEALDRLLKLNIYKNFEFQSSQEFRETVIYNIEVDRVLKNYEPLLKSLYTSHINKQVKSMTRKGAIDIVNYKLGLNISEKSIIFAYGCSKMSVLDIIKESHKLETLAYVEFLEFICRIAHEKFKDSEFHRAKLHLKIERILQHRPVKSQTPISRVSGKLTAEVVSNNSKGDSKESGLQLFESIHLQEKVAHSPLSETNKTSRKLNLFM